MPAPHHPTPPLSASSSVKGSSASGYSCPSREASPPPPPPAPLTPEHPPFLPTYTPPSERTTPPCRTCLSPSWTHTAAGIYCGNGHRLALPFPSRRALHAAIDAAHPVVRGPARILLEYAEVLDVFLLATVRDAHNLLVAHHTRLEARHEGLEARHAALAREVESMEAREVREVREKEVDGGLEERHAALEARFAALEARHAALAARVEALELPPNEDGVVVSIRGPRGVAVTVQAGPERGMQPRPERAVERGDDSWMDCEG